MVPVAYRVLGRYVPQRWRASAIGPELVEMLRSLGFKPHIDPAHGPQPRASWCSKADHAEVRIWASGDTQGTQWHQDGDTTPGARMDCALVLWCNHHPTQFKGSDGVVFAAEPYEVVWAHNQLLWHRRPPEVTEGKRWVFRQRVAL